MGIRETSREHYIFFVEDPGKMLKNDETTGSKLHIMFWDDLSVKKYSN